MKKLVLIMLVFVAVVSTASSDSQHTTIQPDLNLNINVGIPMQSAFRIYFDALEPGSPITLPIPVGFTDPKICCYNDCGSIGICCFKC